LENCRGPLSPQPAQLSADPGPSPRTRPVCQPVTTSPSLTDGVRLSAPSSLKFPLLHTRVSSPAKFPATGQPPVTTPRHKEAHVFACRLESSCNATTPLLCCRPSLLQPRCRARSSTMKPHATWPASRADAAESTPSRLRCSPAGARV
jgi:hypothetical protein